MKIIIVGAGKIGCNLSKSLADENNDVYLIEQSEKAARNISEKLDVKVIIGSGADPDILKAANVSSADLVLAVTTSDETNLVVCSLAGMFGAKRSIARVRNTSLSDALAEFGHEHFHIDEVINPELIAADVIRKAINSPGASGVADFADGKLLLRVFDVPEKSPLCEYTLEELRDEDFPWPFVIVAVIKGDNITIPKGDTRLKPGDKVYVLLPSPSLAEFLTFVDPQFASPRKIVIYGATITGTRLAQTLVDTIPQVILVDENIEAANKVAGELKNVTVIHGSPSEADILTECGIEVTDVFIATSENDHSNLVSSVLAKKMGAKSTMITTQQPDYMAIVNALDIDVIINPHYLAVEQILHMVQGKGIGSVIKLLRGDAEVLEFIPNDDAPVTKDLVKNISFPDNTIVGAIHREDKTFLVNGDTQIQQGDRVYIFCLESAVKKLQKLFIHK